VRRRSQRYNCIISSRAQNKNTVSSAAQTHFECSEQIYFEMLKVTFSFLTERSNAKYTAIIAHLFLKYVRAELLDNEAGRIHATKNDSRGGGHNVRVTPCDAVVPLAIGTVG